MIDFLTLVGYTNIVNIILEGFLDMKTKKVLTLIMAGTLASAALLAGCGSDNNTAVNSTNKSDSSLATTATVSGSSSKKGIYNDTGEMILKESDPFMLPIEDVFTISGRGTVCSGKVMAGSIKVGDVVQIVGSGMETKQASVVGVEKFQDQLEVANFNDNVGIVLNKDQISRNDIKRGMFLILPDAYKPVQSFEADIYFCQADECSDPAAAGEFKSGSKASLTVNTESHDVTVTLADGKESAAPGETVRATVSFDYPIILDGTKTDGKYDRLFFRKDNTAFAACKIIST